jgi:hypothetical protein
MVPKTSKDKTPKASISKQEPITLSSIPFEEIKDLKFSEFSKKQNLTVEELKELWVTAVLVEETDPIIEGWHYAPWIDGTFATIDGEYSFGIFLGGLGMMTTPNHEVSHFMVKFPEE